MGIGEVELARSVTKVADTYVEHYRLRYGLDPVPLDAQARTLLKDLIRRIGEGKLLDLVKHYLSLDGPGLRKDGTKDSWFIQRGHDIDTLSKNLPGLNASLGSTGRQAWVVGFSESGGPITSYDRDALQGSFKPVLVETWLKQSYQEKVQGYGDRPGWERTIEEWINDRRQV